MATDNKGVMVYLPSDLEEVLEKYCTENKITRKNKDGEPVASMGTGIVHYLRSKLLSITPSNLLAGITPDDVQSLIDQAITPLTSDLVNIQSQIINPDNWDDLTADVADLREQLATTRALTMEDVTAQCSSRVEIQAVIDRAVEKFRVELADVKQDCDFTTEGIQRLIADAISKVSIGTTTAKKPQPSTHEDGRIDPAKFAEDHGLAINRRDSAGDIKAALEAAGLAGQYKYNSTVRAFYEVG